MRAQLITVQGEIYNLKARAFIERHEQGLFIISDGHSNQTLLVVKSADIVSYIPTGKPKPPKAKREPRTQTLTLNADTAAISALIGELVKLLSDDDADPQLVDGLLTGLGLDGIHDELATLRHQVDNLEASRDSVRQQIENVGHNELELGKQLARIVSLIGDDFENPNAYILTGLKPPAIQPPMPALHQANEPAPAPTPDPVAIDETTAFPRKRRAKADVLDSQRINPEAGSNSACSDCGRYTRHSVNCKFMDEGVQSEPCNEALGKPE